MKKVTVIIPLYNKELHIKQCVLSVMNQSYSNLEIIVVNDGSTDNSVAMLDDLLGDQRLMIVNQENHGFPYARNRGIECATGDYIVFVDADDGLSRYYVESLVFCAETHHLDVVKTYFTKNIDELSNSVCHSCEILGVPNFVYRLKDDFAYKVGMAWGGCYSRSLLMKKNIRFAEQYRYGVDTLFLTNVLTSVYKVGVVPARLYYYNMMNEGIWLSRHKAGYEYYKSALDCDMSLFRFSILLQSGSKREKLLKMFWKYVVDVYNSLNHDDRMRLYYNHICKYQEDGVLLPTVTVDGEKLSKRTWIELYGYKKHFKLMALLRRCLRK